jgi:hypothetical protein
VLHRLAAAAAEGRIGILSAGTLEADSANLAGQRVFAASVKTRYQMQLLQRPLEDSTPEQRIYDISYELPWHWLFTLRFLQYVQAIVVRCGSWPGA